MPNKRRKLAGAVRPYFGGRRAKQDPPDATPPVITALAAAPPSPGLETVEPSHNVALPRVTPKPKRKSSDPKSAVRAAASSGGWAMLEMGEELQIDISTGGDRSQIVSASFDRRDREGLPVIVFSSLCGPFVESAAAPLLRYNAKLPYGAFAAERTADREEMIVLRATLPAQSADAAAIRQIIAEIAARADKVEGKLTGRDQF